MRKLPEINTLVVKIGSNILVDENEGVSLSFIEGLVSSLSKIKHKVKNIVIVSSGAVGAGFKLLGFDSRPRDIADKQACASIGQTKLMWFYDSEFKKHNINVGQVLITRDDFSNRRRYLNARYTIRRLLELGAVPIINENDTVVVHELKNIESFGDNDNLSSLVAGLINADMLLILSDVDGLYDKNPTEYDDAELMSEVKYVDEDMIGAAGESVSGIGTGGMRSKVKAASKALSAGCYVGIINGKDTENINRFISGEEVGTFFSHIEDPMNRRKLWLAHAAEVKGSVVVDDGAVNALINNKKSLLATGISGVSGSFGIGDVISVYDKSGNEIARGKSRYTSGDVKKIRGRKSSEIFDILGYKLSDDVIHRDDLVVMVVNGSGK